MRLDILAYFESTLLLMVLGISLFSCTPRTEMPLTTADSTAWTVADTLSAVEPVTPGTALIHAIIGECDPLDVGYRCTVDVHRVIEMGSATPIPPRKLELEVSPEEYRLLYAVGTATGKKLLLAFEEQPDLGGDRLEWQIVEIR